MDLVRFLWLGLVAVLSLTSCAARSFRTCGQNLLSPTLVALMVRCEQDSMFVPADRAVRENNHPYCSLAHRNAARHESSR